MKHQKAVATQSGNELPQYFWIRLRLYVHFIILAKYAYFACIYGRHHNLKALALPGSWR